MIKLYNTLSRKKEVFKPIKKGKINMFVCGQTVYDHSHVGHAKTYVQFDLIARYLRILGYKVFYLQNITDIDDKIIKKAREEKMGWKEITKRYENSYLSDMKKLNINSVNKYAKATNYIPQIISQVKRLIKKGYAYKISDGWYFDLSKDKDYGKLARRTLLEADDAVSRIDENKEKKNKGDFCLWKFSKPKEPVWKTDIGDGRPGWHIEDTAITEKEFGSQYDIHGGGIDLIFPHHEAEIAQMESISGKKPLVRYWVHTEFLRISGEKMGKSKKNFYTIKEIFDRGYSPLDLRYFFLSAHYRRPLNFSFRALDYAKNSLQRLREIILKLDKKQKKNKKNIDMAYKQFLEFLNDDINTPRALSYMWEILRENRLNDSEKYDLILKFDKVFGLDLDKVKEIKVSKELEKLILERERLRVKKDWKKADEIIKKINKLGFVIEDIKERVVVKKR